MSSAPKKEAGPLESALKYLKTDNGQRVAVVAFSVVATLVLVAFPGGYAALAFGLPFLFFIPGFTVVRLFFWRTTTPEAKLVLSMALSILVVIFLALIIAFSSPGLTPDTSKASLITFSVSAVLVEAFLLPANRGRESVPEELVAPPPKMDKVVAGMLVTALVVSVVSLGIIVNSEYPSRTYFAVTGTDGKVVSNTSRLVNTTLTVLLHMKNGEDGPRNFTVSGYVVNWDEFGSYSYTRAMAKGEVWNQTMTFNLTKIGIFRLDFDLYIQDAAEPPFKYGHLQIWIGVYESFD